MELFVSCYANTAWGSEKCPPCKLAAAACKRRHICDWSHRSEIYPGWSLGAQEGRWRPIQSHRILPGVVSQQHWLIGFSRVKKGSGTGRRNRITTIDHLPARESRGHGHKNQSCAIISGDDPRRPSRRKARTPPHGGERCGCNWRTVWWDENSGDLLADSGIYLRPLAVIWIDTEVWK